MQITEFKSTLTNWIIDIIHQWFPDTNLQNKLVKPMVIHLIKTNVDKADKILEAFADKDGNINVSSLLEEYENYIPDDGLVLNLQDYIGNNSISKLFTPKVLDKEDINNLKKLLKENGIS